MSTFIVVVYIILISGPLYLGGAMFLMSIFRRQETSVTEVFYGFERFGKSTGIFIVTSIFTFLWFFALVIPAYIAAIRYSMSYFILADNPNIGVMEAINESKRIMRGNKWKFFCLYLSFIGWGILGSITIVGSLFVMPYIYITLVAFYDIANGSLRSVSSIGGYRDLQNEYSASGTEDPITVYKEDPRIRSRIQEAAGEPQTVSAPEQELPEQTAEPDLEPAVETVLDEAAEPALE